MLIKKIQTRFYRGFYRITEKYYAYKILSLFYSVIWTDSVRKVVISLPSYDCFCNHLTIVIYKYTKIDFCLK